MSVNLPGAWAHDAADIKRDEEKREWSPASFFCAQGQAILLAAQYFDDTRLVKPARGGVAMKHRHRIHLALYGQLMASFEYLLKDFVARATDITDLFDEQLRKSDWIRIDVERAIAWRGASVSVGALLIHPTLGWHEPSTVNQRYKAFFDYEPFSADEAALLARLWMLRHSVAHNAGFVTKHDALRANAADLSEKVVAINDIFIKGCFDALKPIARRLAEIGGANIVKKWFLKRVTTPDYNRDKFIFETLAYLGCCVEARTTDLPKIGKAAYTAGYKASRSGPKAKMGKKS